MRMDYRIEDTDDGPRVISITEATPRQPTPEDTLYGYFPEGDPSGTAISRWWRPGEAGRCTLCAECGRNGDHCLVLVHNRIVAPEACATYRQEGARRAAGPLRVTTS